MVCSHLSERSAESAKLGLHKKKMNAVTTPSIAKMNGSAVNDVHTNAPDP